MLAMIDDEKPSELSATASPHDDSSTKSENHKSIEADTEPEPRNGIVEADKDVNSDSSHVENGLSPPSERQSERQPLHDPNLIEWDGDSDPENPLNFAFWRKVWLSIMASFLTFAVGFSSSIFSAVTRVTAEGFGVSDEVMVLGVSLYVLGFACGTSQIRRSCTHENFTLTGETGPLFFGPVSELYGRSRPLLIGFFCFAIFNIPVAVATNLETIFICRFLTAAFGGSAVAIAPGIVVDLWHPYARGIATLGWATTVFAAPTVGPIVGEFTVRSIGWRWTMWLPVIFGLAIWVVALPTVSETFAPLLLQRKAARLRYETKNWALHSKRDEQPITYGYLARKYGVKPFQMLIQEPILLAMTGFMSLVYALIYLTFVAFPYSFQVVRQWEIGLSSLPFVAVLIGYLLGFVLSVLESRFRYQPLLQKHSGGVPPEERLPPMIAGAVIIIGGLFWFAWTSSPNITWVPQVVAGIPVGCGIFMIFMPGQVYLIDIYTQNAASALAANACVRAALACAFPLFATPMYSQLGVEWATSLLAFLCIALSPFPVLFYIYGKRVRGWSKYVLDE